jgi:hypothetical protein
MLMGRCLANKLQLVASDSSNQNLKEGLFVSLEGWEGRLTPARGANI